MRVPVHHIHCDRCNGEIGQDKPTEQEEAPPVLYRLLVIDGKSDEKKLQHLCDRCKREVKLLDERIFSDVRVHKTAEKSDEKGATSDA